MSADVADDMVSTNISRVLVIYTGGTIGMKNTPQHGYNPVPGYLTQTLSSMTRFHDPVGFATGATVLDINPPSRPIPAFPLTNPVNVPLSYDKGGTGAGGGEGLRGNVGSEGGEGRIMINGTPVMRTRKAALITPPSLYGKRILYSILEYDPLLDSANMTMSDWVKLATDIEVNYRLFDAFIVLHGTDTMAFTASALSFMLEDLGKTVILTGSQVPLAEVRNDAVDNLLGALTIAGHFVIPEVGLFFGNKLYRGNRSSKIDAVDFSAFESPNLRALVSVGINIDVSWTDILRPTTIAQFRAHKKMDPSVATLRFFPGITEATVRAFLSPPVRGVVLETYGAGNAPNNRPDILAALREASERGVVIVNCTQCKRGVVTDIYATGKALLEVGVVPGADMTPECALTKLSYLLGHNYPPSECRALIRRNLRGELTVPSRRQRFAYHQGQGLVHSVMSLLGSESGQRTGNVVGGVPMTPVGSGDGTEMDMVGMERALIPMLMCHAARVGDVGGLSTVVGEFLPMINMGDYDGRTPLHVAASENRVSVIEFLLRHGATVHSRDRFGHTALWDAAKMGHSAAVSILRSAGGHFSEAEMDNVAAKIARAADRNDLDTLKLWTEGGGDLNRAYLDGRTPLHLASSNGHIEIVKYIVSSAIKIAASERKLLSAPSSVVDYNYSSEEAGESGTKEGGRNSETSIQYSIEIDLEKMD
ncbi:hypothetical protein HK097_000496, partial [Rhizophlyctis rosea]